MLDFGASLLRRLPAETAHDLTLALMARLKLAPRRLADPPVLRVQALGLSFPNPVGLAAGFDKNAALPDAMGKLGFGFVECGTVTPRPQAGNSKPRLFRLSEDRAVINRMGFNNGGMTLAAANLKRRTGQGIVGINIGANKDSEDRIADYRTAFAELAALADYVTVNISSPNTPGLRGLQNRGELTRLIGTVLETRGAAATPVLVKIAPDLDEAARVDGCTHFQAFRWVIMPVMWPGVITTGLFSFLLGYNDFLVTSLLLDASNQTMVPAIAGFFNRETTMTDQVEAIAAAVSITAPLFLLVMVFQRQIVSGLTAGAVKG